MNSNVPQIKDIDPIWVWPYEAYVTALVCCLGVVLLAGLIWMLWHFIKNKKLSSLNAHQRAKKVFKDLQKSSLPLDQKYLLLDLEFRKFFDSYFKVGLAEWTWPERKAWLKKSGQVYLKQEWWMDFWERSEQVKFAASSVTDEVFLQDLFFIQDKTDQLYKKTLEKPKT